MQREVLAFISVSQKPQATGIERRFSDAFLSRDIWPNRTIWICAGHCVHRGFVQKPIDYQLYSDRL